MPELTTIFISGEDDGRMTARQKSEVLGRAEKVFYPLINAVFTCSPLHRLRKHEKAQNQKGDKHYDNTT